MTSRRLMSELAAARFLGIPSGELQQLCEAGDVPHVRLPGDRLRFYLPDLWAWIDARKRNAVGAEDDTPAAVV